jgi:integrase
MARTPRPWYRVERDEWRVTVRGIDHCLGKHPVGVPAPRKQRGKWNAPQIILNAFHALLLVKPESPKPLASAPAPLVVADVFDKFLDWCEKNRSPRTYEWSRNHILSFLDFVKNREEPVHPTMFPADNLKPFHVQEWVDANKQAKPGKRAWGDNHRRGAITAVLRAFAWAQKAGHLARNPILGVEKPSPKRREQVLTRPEFDTLLSNVMDLPFRDVLEFCWETGARVQEVRLIEAAHFKPERGRVQIPPRQAKGKKRWRIVYLTPRAEEIVRRLAHAKPEGPIFLNVDGNPWDAQNFNNRFCRLEKKLGVKYALTAIRHSFCQRLLEAGVDHTTVAALMGHSNAVMVSTTYSHMDQAKDFLREELLRAQGAGTASS